MFQRIIGFIFRRRHYWRNVSFDEVAELYASRLLTMLALNAVNLFTSLYLYQLGYSIVFIMLMNAALLGFKIAIAPIVASYVAYFGPKHGVLVANLLRIPSMAAIFLVPEYGVWAIVIYGVFQQAAAGMYGVSYLVDFSKVRHAKHTGKELGTMQLVEKAARVVSPLAGGLVASFWGPSAVIFVSAILFALAALPLFRTVEPTTLKTRVRVTGFPWKLAKTSLFTEVQIGFDLVTSTTAWALFAAIAVFAAFGNGMYAAFGVLASFGVLVSMLASWLFGKLTDKRHGDFLFTAGVVSNAVTHALRPFVTVPLAVLGVNMANETATSAYALPWTRAVFNIADTSGFRIAYMAMLQAASDIGSLIACLALAGLVWFFGAMPGMQLFFICSAFLGLIILAGRRYTR